MVNEVQVARDLYAALKAGDRDRLSELLHPSFVARATEGLPLGLGGVYNGVEEAWREFWGRIGENFRVRAEPQGFHPLTDGGLLVTGEYVGKARATDTGVDAAFAHLLRFTGDQVSELIQYTDSARWAQALDVSPKAEAAPRRELSVVDFELNDGLARIRLNRPAARNALNLDMALDLNEVSLRCAESPGLRAVLLTGEGPAFTVGGDVKLFASTEHAELPVLIHQMIVPYHEALDRLARLDAPIVCAVHGAAAGGGLGLMHCADLVLAAESTKFALGFSALGLSGDGGSTWFLPRMIGSRRAAELFFQPRVLTAREAEEWGLVSRVVADDALEGEALTAARRLAAGPTRAFAELRHLLRAGWDNTLTEQLLAEQGAQERTAATADAAEGVAAFKSKREPDFNGR
jgi:2-(1,2-epoxy-1,2-dihydrophenyl)acetyl-CoA isomerase